LAEPPPPRRRVARRTVAGAFLFAAWAALVTPWTVLAADLVTEYHPPPRDDASLADATSIVAGPDGALWFPMPGGIGNHIGRITTAGEFNVFTVDARTNNDTRLAIGSDGAIWFTQWGGGEHNRLGRIQTDGTSSFVDLPPGTQPHGIATASDGALWIAAFASMEALRYDLRAGALTRFPLPASIGRPGAVAPDPGGVGAWIAGELSEIVHLDAAGAVLAVVPTGLQVAEMVVGPDRHLWLSFGTNNAVGRLEDDGSVSRIPVGRQAFGLAFDTLGQLWIAGQSGGPEAVLLRLDPASRTTTTVPIPSVFGSPSAIALGSDDQIWFIESRFAADPATPNVGRETIGRALTGAPIRAGGPGTPGPFVATAGPFPRVHGFEALTLPNLGASAIWLAGAYVLLVLPSTLFNRALESGRARIPAIKRIRSFAVNGTEGLVVVGAIGAFIYTLATLPTTPDQPIATFLQLALSLLAPVAIVLLVAYLRLRRHAGVPRTRSYPLGLVIAVLFAAFGAWVGVAGLLAYGVITTWEPPQLPGDASAPGDQADNRGKAIAIERAGIVRTGSALVLLLAVLAWLPLAVARPEGFLEAIFSGLFVCGIEALMFGMLPVPFLAGAELEAGGMRRSWMVLWLCGAALFIVFVVSPGLEREFRNADLDKLQVAAPVFAAIGTGFWAAMALLELRQRRRPPTEPST
jgi:virginiamycin B lyase